jgi:hypothetical protein
VNNPCKILAAAFVAASLLGPAATSRAVELDPKVLTFKLPDQINWGRLPRLEINKRCFSETPPSQAYTESW